MPGVNCIGNEKKIGQGKRKLKSEKLKKKTE